MQTETYLTVTGRQFKLLVRPPKSDPIPTNAAAAKFPRYIKHHAAQVYQRRQMVKSEDILNHKLLDSLDEKYFKGQHQAYINYTNRTLIGLIQNMYDDHGKISPMGIE